MLRPESGTASYQVVIDALSRRHPNIMGCLNSTTLELLRTIPEDIRLDQISIRNNVQTGKEMNSRIESCRSTRRSNCHGTAFYIIGEQGNDEYVGKKSDSLFNMKMLAAPIEGCLVAFVPLRSLVDRVKNFPKHSGVVTSLDPLLVTHRISEDGEFVENQPFEDVRSMRYFGHGHQYLLDTISLFYLPRNLEI